MKKATRMKRTFEIIESNGNVEAVTHFDATGEKDAIGIALAMIGKLSDHDRDALEYYWLRAMHGHGDDAEDYTDIKQLHEVIGAMTEKSKDAAIEMALADAPGWDDAEFNRTVDGNSLPEQIDTTSIWTWPSVDGEVVWRYNHHTGEIAATPSR